MLMGVVVLGVLVAGLASPASTATPQCTVDTVFGCYLDDNNNRTFAFQGSSGTSMTRESCAAMCNVFDFPSSAVEYGIQCFCGTEEELRNAVLAANQGDCNEPCSGDKSEVCGAADRMNIFNATCTGQLTPSGHACISPNDGYKFCDTSLSVEERLNSLIGMLTLEEKVGLIGPNPATSICAFLDFGVKRLGIPEYLHLVETNTAVASACIAPGKCVTTFIGPTGLGASFNRTSWNFKGEVISDEMRAYNNLNWHRGAGDPQKIGLTGFGPNINIARDPRFGRNSELPGEDPFLSGEYAANYVRGCQEGPDKNYAKMIAGLKHYDAYSVETNRAGFSANISFFDLWDTYLPQYRAGFVDGGAYATMCSYASINGVPSCANNYILNEVVRGMWNRSDVLVGTDCGAINNMINANHYASDATDAVIKTLKGGADMELGDAFFTTEGTLLAAVNNGALSVDYVNAALYRTLHKRFITGQFDPVNATEYTSYGFEMINSTRHQQINFEAALQGLVLLKNDNDALPLKKGIKLAVVGPHSVSTAGLFSDYAGDEKCFGGGYECVTPIGTWLDVINEGGSTVVAEGVGVIGNDQSGIPAALDAVKASDAVVLCLGLNNTIEHEGIDRQTINLPGLQEQFAQQVLAAAAQRNVPVVLVLVNGGMVAIDNLVAGPASIVEAFYPNVVGSEALARTLFGEHNRFGKMPATIYPLAFQDQCALTDFEMQPHSTCPGRTYRYYNATPLFAFGHGLSYTNFTVTCKATTTKVPVAIQCSVDNTHATMAGDEVLLVYHSVSAGIREKLQHPAPIKALVAFDRVSVGAGATETLTFTLGESAFAITDAKGEQTLYPGEHTIQISQGHGKDIQLTFTL